MAAAWEGAILGFRQQVKIGLDDLWGQLSEDGWRAVWLILGNSGLSDKQSRQRNRRKFQPSEH